MATSFVSSGAYILESDNSLYTPASAPTIVGLVGTATKGELDEATLVTSEGQLIDLFGRPRSKDYAMQAAIEILKTCRTMYFVRVAGAAKTKGTIAVLDAGSGATVASIGPSANAGPFALSNGLILTLKINNVAQPNVVFDGTAGTRVCQQAEPYNLNAIAGGGPTTLTVKIDGGSTQTVTFAAGGDFVNYAAATAEEIVQVLNDHLVGASAATSAVGTLVNITSDTLGLGSTVQVTGGTANVAVNGPNFITTVATGTSTAGIHNLAATTATEVKTLIEGLFAGVLTVGTTSDFVTLRTVATGGTPNSIEIVSATSTVCPTINLTPLDSRVYGTNTSAAAATISYTAHTFGSHSADVDVVVSTSAALTGTKKVVVKYRDITVETYDKLYHSPTPVVGGYDMIGAINSGTSDAAYSASEWIVAADLGAGVTENPANGTYTLSTGNDGDNWTEAGVVGTITGNVYTGLQCFSNPEIIDVSILATPGISYASVISAGLTLCAARADCIFVADAPWDLNVSDATKWHNGDASVTIYADQELRTETNSTKFNSSYGAVYFPFVQLYDKYNDADIWLPPSSIVIKTYCYTDAVADPWYAPAGPNRSQTTSVLDIEYSATQGERDLMQQSGNNLNPLANIAGIGITIMGQKTLQRAPTALDRVNVRRMLLFLEKSIARSVKYLMFEQNDEIMWRRFSNLIDPLLSDVKTRRGLYDYRIVADSTTTTPLMQDNNTFVGKIFLKPTKTAEILIVSFNLVSSGGSFDESVSS
jgi:phage tail sheath protein FI